MTDYDAYDQYFIGAWSNPANNLTLLIQKNGEVEHGYTFTIQSDTDTYVVPVQLERGGSISYTEVNINFTEKKEVKGQFIIDGNLLIWSREEPIGEFENATIFTRVQ